MRQSTRLAGSLSRVTPSATRTTARRCLCTSSPTPQSLRSLPASFYRGGTSKALMLLASALPPKSEKEEWASILLSAMGSPDPNGRQLDGMGGGYSSVSKVCVMEKSEREDADVDYTFVQIGVKDPSLDLASNCGNMSNAVGPYAVEKGLPYIVEDGESGKQAVVRIYNTNTKKVIHSRFPLEADGRPSYSGDFGIDGVPGTSARIQLDFVSPGGAATGKLLPTGRLVDTIDDVPGLGSIEVSLIDCANPCIFISAEALGVEGTLLPDAICAHPTLLQQLEAIRCKGGVAMGMFASEEEASRTKSVPKVCFVSAPTPHTLLSGERVEDPNEADVLVRTISTGDPHRAIPITVSLCVAAAAEMKGSIVQQALRKDGSRADEKGLVIAHPSGKMVVGAQVENSAGKPEEIAVKAGTVFGTARKLFEGEVFYRA